MESVKACVKAPTSVEEMAAVTDSQLADETDQFEVDWMAAQLAAKTADDLDAKKVALMADPSVAHLAAPLVDQSVEETVVVMDALMASRWVAMKVG